MDEFQLAILRETLLASSPSEGLAAYRSAMLNCRHKEVQPWITTYVGTLPLPPLTRIGISSINFRINRDII